MSWKMTALGAAASAAMVSTAMGGIDFPPPWANSGIQGNSTHWRWDFDPNTGDPSQPSGFGPGTPQLIPNGSWQFSPTDPNNPPPSGSGVIVIFPGGHVDILVPNFPDPNLFKYIWIQYHYTSIGAEPATGASANGTNATPYGPTVTPSHPTDPATGAPLPGLVGAHGWQFPFNPAFEIITISNPDPNVPMTIDWLTIDTICAPSPAAAALLGLSGLVAAGRRRR